MGTATSRPGGGTNTSQPPAAYGQRPAGAGAPGAPMQARGGGGPVTYLTPEQIQSLFLGGHRDMFPAFGVLPSMIPPAPPRVSVEQAITIRNEINLKKSSLRLLTADAEPSLVDPASMAAAARHSAAMRGWGAAAAHGPALQPSVLYLDFVFDANTPCAISVYFVAQERDTAKGASLTSGIATLRPGLGVRRTVFPKGLSQRFCAAIDPASATPHGSAAAAAGAAALSAQTQQQLLAGPAGAGGAPIKGSGRLAGADLGGVLDLSRYSLPELTNVPLGPGGAPSSSAAPAGAIKSAAAAAAASGGRGSLPPHLYPLVIVLESASEAEVGTSIPIQASQGAAAGPFGSSAAASQLQVTYATFVHSPASPPPPHVPGASGAPALASAAAAAVSAPAGAAVDDGSGLHVSKEWRVKPLRQKIQVGGRVYVLQEIYGMDTPATGDSGTPGGAPGAAKAATAQQQGEAGVGSVRDGGEGAPLQAARPLSSTVGAAMTQAVRDMVSSGSECVICLSEARDTTVLPCRHMCLCHDCAQQLRFNTNKCPICREPVESLLRIQISGMGAGGGAAARPADDRRASNVSGISQSLGRAAAAAGAPAGQSQYASYGQQQQQPLYAGGYQYPTQPQQQVLQQTLSVPFTAPRPYTGAATPWATGAPPLQLSHPSASGAGAMEQYALAQPSQQPQLRPPGAPLLPPGVSGPPGAPRPPPAAGPQN